MSEHSKSETFHTLYGVWLHGQITSLIDQANARKSEIPAGQSADVHAALADLEKILGKLKK